MSLSHNILLIRKTAKLSQEAFGKRFGVTKDMVYTYEKDLAKPDDIFVEKVADFARVSFADLTKKRLKPSEIALNGHEDVIYPDAFQFLAKKIVKIEAGQEVERSILIDILAKITGKTQMELRDVVSKALEREISIAEGELRRGMV